MLYIYWWQNFGFLPPKMYSMKWKAFWFSVYVFVYMLWINLSCSVMSNFLRPRGLLPTRFHCPWDFPGKNIGVDCYFLLQGIFLTQGSSLHLSLYLYICRRILGVLKECPTCDCIRISIILHVKWNWPCISNRAQGLDTSASKRLLKMKRKVQIFEGGRKKYYKRIANEHSS